MTNRKSGHNARLLLGASLAVASLGALFILRDKKESSTMNNAAIARSGFILPGEPLATMVLSAEKLNHIPKNLLARLLWQESRYNPKALNRDSGAAGIAQIMAATAKGPGYGVKPIANRYDVAESVRFAAQYLAAMRRNTNSWSDALAAYNGGLGAVLYFNKNGAWPKYNKAGKVIGTKPRPLENINYPAQILADVTV